MSEIQTRPSLTSASASASSASSLAEASSTNKPDVLEFGAVDPAHLDFQAMVDGDDDADAGWSPGSVGGADNGVMQFFRNVDASRLEMQSSLLKTSIAGTPTNIFESVRKLSTYDLQTLLGSKLANKAFQAVDRLTNLQ